MPDGRRPAVRAVAVEAAGSLLPADGRRGAGRVDVVAGIAREKGAERVAEAVDEAAPAAPGMAA